MGLSGETVGSDLLNSDSVQTSVVEEQTLTRSVGTILDRALWLAGTSGTNSGKAAGVRKNLGVPREIKLS